MKERILIVGGEEQWLRSVQRQLAQHPKYEVITATNVPLARGLLTSREVAVVVVDRAHTKESGTRLLKEVAAEFPSCLRLGTGGEGVHFVVPEKWEPQTVVKLVERWTASQRPPQPPPLPKQSRHASASTWHYLGIGRL